MEGGGAESAGDGHGVSDWGRLSRNGRCGKEGRVGIGTWRPYLRKEKGGGAWAGAERWPFAG